MADRCNSPKRLNGSIRQRGPTTILTIANLGHATLLMNYFGVRIISDPTLFDRVGLALDSILTFGPRRYVAPPLRRPRSDPSTLSW